MSTSRSFVVFPCTLAVLLAAAQAGLLTGRYRSRYLPSSPLSSYSSTFESSGGVCLNGGTSFPSLTTGEHMFCLCADGFEGRRCETATSKECYEGVGLYYRGSASTSASGLPCEPWDLDTRRRYLLSDEKAGRHNHCRNILYKTRPWCYVRKNRQLEWEYCDIPRCGAHTLPVAPSSPPAVPSDPPPESTCGQRSRPKLMKIVGGSVSAVEAQPWISAIFYRGKSKEKVFLCGGSLIHSCWVLTAAHCFPDGIHSRPGRFTVSLGRNALNESDPDAEQNFKVEEIILHQSFDSSKENYDHDIALMRLRPKRGRCAEETKSVKTICLPPPHQKLLPGTTCEIAGYGKEKYGLWYRSQFLREAQVSLIADAVCRQDDHYGHAITDNMFCAAAPEWNRDACEGDSGGPLACEVAGRLFLFGVVSWGEGCALEFKPGVYTTVTNYNQWIEEKTGLGAIASGAMFPQK
ncbi:unnamed protein product [Ophioblennius macclurei]